MWVSIVLIRSLKYRLIIIIISFTHNSRKLRKGNQRSFHIPIQSHINFAFIHPFIDGTILI